MSFCKKCSPSYDLENPDSAGRKISLRLVPLKMVTLLPVNPLWVSVYISILMSGRERSTGRLIVSS